MREDDVLELSCSAEAPVSQIVEDIGAHLSEDTRDFEERLRISEKKRERQIRTMEQAFQMLKKTAIDPEVRESIGKPPMPLQMR
jgi:hypothetical protein